MISHLPGAGSYPSFASYGHHSSENRKGMKSLYIIGSVYTSLVYGLSNAKPKIPSSIL